MLKAPRTRALNYYGWASGPYVKWEENQERVGVLADFVSEREKADADGSDAYVYESNPADPLWDKSFRGAAGFEYDGRMQWNTPHGMGVGQWENTKELFCGIWESGYPKKGIYAFGNGDIYVGTLNRGKFVKGIYTRSDHTKIEY